MNRRPIAALAHHPILHTLRLSQGAAIAPARHFHSPAAQQKNNFQLQSPCNAFIPSGLTSKIIRKTNSIRFATPFPPTRPSEFDHQSVPSPGQTDSPSLHPPCGRFLVMKPRIPHWPAHALWTGALLLAACARAPQPAAPPPQYQPSAQAALSLIAPAEPGSDAFILEGVLPAAADAPDAPYRWTASTARFRSPRPPSPNDQLLTRFAIDQSQLSPSGSVLVTIRLDGRLLAENRVASTGIQEILAPLPVLARPQPGLPEITLIVSPAAPSARGVKLYTIGFLEPPR